jgi:uncharacterized membrane protein
MELWPLKDWLNLATNVAVDAIDWLALILIVVGAVEAFFRGLWTMFASPDGHHEGDVWLRLGRWLVAGLTFQLAADVLATAITTSWDEVARLAAIAAIRTFLNYFLERDLGEVRQRQNAPAAGP